MTTGQWTSLAAILVDHLVNAGDLRSQEWIDAFRHVPRHVFVPEVIELRAGIIERVVTETETTWLGEVYSDQSLVVQVKPHPGGHRSPTGAPLCLPTSSSTVPSLMARMLEALDVRDGHRVLEIGTGTGYNAALLAHRLGAGNVVSIDIDPELVETARVRLAALSQPPTLVVGDGTLGVPELGPWDRIIATAAVPELPLAWIDQLADTGMVLANIRGDLAGGCLCLLAKDEAEGVVSGRFLPLGGHFMWARPEAGNPLHPHESTAPVVDLSRYSRTTTPLDPSILDDEGFRFLLQLQAQGVCPSYRADTYDPHAGNSRRAVVLSATDGSRAAVFTDTNDVHAVLQSGPRRLWDTVESTARLWTELGEPAVDRFGITAHDDGNQYVWLDTSDAPCRWPLPLV